MLSTDYLVLMHELGGHGFIKYVKNDPENNGWQTIDYENITRALKNLSVSDYDRSHEMPRDPRLEDIRKKLF